MNNDGITLIDRKEVLPGLPLRIFNFRQPNEIPHEHNFHELVLVRRGRGVHLTENGESPIRRGDVFLIPPGVMHTYSSVESLEIANVLFVPEELRLPVSELAETEGYHLLFPPVRRFSGGGSGLNHLALNDSQLRRAEEEMSAMLIEQQHRNPGWSFFLQLHFMALLGLVCRAYPERTGASEDEFDRLSQVTDYIEAHYAEPLTLDGLSKIGSRSKCTLIRMFRRAYNCTPIGYLLELRLERAAELLRDTELTVTEVAMRCGVCDSNYFTKLCARKYRMPPREYRQARFDRKRTASGSSEKL